MVYKFLNNRYSVLSSVLRTMIFKTLKKRQTGIGKIVFGTYLKRETEYKNQTKPTEQLLPDFHPFSS